MKKLITFLFAVFIASVSLGATITVSTVSDLANARVGDGDLVQTSGQVTKDDGGGMLYRYDAASVAVADGVLVVDGPGSAGRFISQVSERAPLTAATIPDDSALLFDVTRTDASVLARTLSMEELKKTGVEMLSVKQYGAVGDGVADDTAAITAAFNAGTAKAVYFPPGTYKLSTWTVYTLTSRSLTVVCDPGAVIDGTGATDFIGCGTSGVLRWEGGRLTGWRYAVLCANSSTGGSKCYLRRMEIDTCTRAIVDAGTNSGEYADFEVSECHIHDCTEFGIGNRGLQIKRCVVRQNLIEVIGGTTASAYGIIIGNDTPNTSTHCVIDGNAVINVSATAAVEVKGILCYANNARIINNTVTDIDGVGANVEGIYAKIRWGNVSNNQLIDAGEGGEGFITVKGQPRVGGNGQAEGWQTEISGNAVIASRASTTDNTGIFVNADDAIVSNNTVECISSGIIYRGIAITNPGGKVRGNVIRNITDPDSTMLGIAITNASNVLCADNIISSVTASAGTSNGILVTSNGSGMTNIRVLRNSISSVIGGAHQIGIGVVHSATINSITIDDNYLTDCSKGVDFGTTFSATVTNAHVRRNHMYNFNRNGNIVVGVWIRGCHQVVVSDNTFDTFNSADAAQDCRAIYVDNGTLDLNRDVQVVRNRISNLTAAAASRERTIHINSGAAFDGLLVADNEMIDVGYIMYSTNVSNVTSFQLLRNRGWSYDTTYTLGTLPAGAVVDGNMAGGVLVFQTTWVRVMSGTGSPEGVVTAPIGTLFLRTDGGASTTLYAKESDTTGSTGWVAK